MVTYHLVSRQYNRITRLALLYLRREGSTDASTAHGHRQRHTWLLFRFPRLMIREYLDVTACKGLGLQYYHRNTHRASSGSVLSTMKDQRSQHDTWKFVRQNRVSPSFHADGKGKDDLPHVRHVHYRQRTITYSVFASTSLSASRKVSNSRHDAWALSAAYVLAVFLARDVIVVHVMSWIHKRYHYAATHFVFILVISAM